jgi:hypothetical protein
LERNFYAAKKTVVNRERLNSAVSANRSQVRSKQDFNTSTNYSESGLFSPKINENSRRMSPRSYPF